VNSEDYYYHLSELRTTERDTYKAAYEWLAEAMKLNVDNARDMELLRTSYNALDQANKDYIAGLEKQVKKETRRKKFWKTMALIEGGIVAVVFGTVFVIN
jgi:hypothetical protein